MKALIILISVFVFGICAHGQICPYRATDANATTLAANTRSIMQDLLDKKNNCSESLRAAVTSVQDLPELITQVKDPAQAKLAEQTWVNSEITRALADPNVAALASPSSTVQYDSTGSAIPSNYLNYLMQRKIQLPGEIEQVRIAAKYQDKEDAKIKIMSMSQNLISSFSTALSSSDTSCARSLSENFAPKILSMGLGLLSAASPLMVGAGVAAASVSTSMLSNLMNLFSKMSPKALRDFDDASQTIDLACAYYSILNLDCSMHENSFDVEQSKRAREKLEAIYTKIDDPNKAIYRDMDRVQKLNTEISSIVQAVTMNSTNNLGAGSLADPSQFDTNVTQIFGGNNVTSDKDTWQNYQQKFALLNTYLSSDAALNTLTTKQKTVLNNQLLQFTYSLKSQFQIEGLNWVPSDPAAVTGRSDDPNPGKAFQLNKDNIQKILDKRVNEFGKAGSASLQALDDISSVHGAINASDLTKKIKYYRDYIKNMTAIADKNPNSVDYAKLKSQMESVDVTLQDLQTWLDTKPDQNDPKKYRENLFSGASTLKSKLHLRTGSVTEVKTRVDLLLSEHITKAQSIFTQKSVPAPSLSSLENPFDQSQARATNYEQVSSIIGTFDLMRNTAVDLKDQNLVTETRRLFESPSSNLRTSFSSGLEAMIDRVASSPDPAVSEKMVDELCALAYSLPSGSTAHALSKCNGHLPPRFKKYIPNPSRTAPECSYYNYYNDATREDFNDTSSRPSIPLHQRKVRTSQ